MDSLRETQCLEAHKEVLVSFQGLRLRIHAQNVISKLFPGLLGSSHAQSCEIPDGRIHISSDPPLS